LSGSRSPVRSRPGRVEIAAPRQPAELHGKQQLQHVATRERGERDAIKRRATKNVSGQVLSVATSTTPAQPRNTESPAREGESSVAGRRGRWSSCHRPKRKTRSRLGRGGRPFRHRRRKCPDRPVEAILACGRPLDLSGVAASVPPWPGGSDRHGVDQQEGTNRSPTERGTPGRPVGQEDEAQHVRPSSVIQRHSAPWQTVCRRPGP